MSKRIVLLLILVECAHVACGTMFPRGGAAAIVKKKYNSTSPSPRKIRRSPFVAETIVESTTALSQTIPLEYSRPSSAGLAEPLISKEHFISLTAFLAGLSDVLCYRRYGCYVNMMTGNTIRCAVSIAEFDFGETARLVTLIGGYVMGTSLFRATYKRLKRINSKRASTAVSVIAAPIIMALLCLAEATSFQPLLALAGSFINSAAQIGTGGTITYALTGHITKLSNGVVDNCMTGKPVTGPSIRVLVSLFAGVVVGAGLLAHTNVLSNLPVFSILGLVYLFTFGIYGWPAFRALFARRTLLTETDRFVAQPGFRM